MPYGSRDRSIVSFVIAFRHQIFLSQPINDRLPVANLIFRRIDFSSHRPETPVVVAFDLFLFAPEFMDASCPIPFPRSREEFVLFGVFAIILLYLSSVGIYYCEHEAQPKAFASIFHCLWWSVCTLTTVGYGDVYPVTAGGRLFTFLVLAIGLGVVAVPTGLVASALSKSREMEQE